MWNINALQGSIPCAIFTKFAECIPFQSALAVKISLDLLKGLGSYGGFKLTGSGYPQISVPPSGKTIRQTPKVLEVQEHARGPLSPCHVWWGTDFIPRRGDQKR